MRHTRFVVVKMRELLKTALFAVLGVIILVGLITFSAYGDGKSAGLYRDGTYEAELPLGQGTASVSVEIRDGRIADVTVTDDAETVSVMYPMVEDAAEEVAQQVVQNQSVENITVADTHTYSAPGGAGRGECLSERRGKMKKWERRCLFWVSSFLL